MSPSKDIYVHFDELDDLPHLNRENYLFELDYLQRELPKNSTVLQVGSMDGMRIVRLLDLRPDLQIVGLEIESELVDRARQNIKDRGLHADFVVGDITDPPDTLLRCDVTICLNNTLGFIPDYTGALQKMRAYGVHTYVSVFGESFTDGLAHRYYEGIGISIDKIDGNRFISEMGTFRRFAREEVISWGGQINQTPLGYLSHFNRAL